MKRTKEMKISNTVADEVAYHLEGKHFNFGRKFLGLYHSIEPGKPDGAGNIDIRFLATEENSDSQATIVGTYEVFIHIEVHKK